MSKNVKNTIIYTIGNILPKAAGFILLPIYTNYLSPSDYGLINAMQIMQPILAILFSAGFSGSVFRLYYDYESIEENKTFFSTMFLFSFFISSVFLLFMLIFNRYIQNIYSSISFFPYFLFTILTTFFSNFFIIPQKIMMLKDQALKYVFWSFMQFILTAGLTLWFLIVFLEGPVGFLKARMISAILLLPFFLFMLRKYINFKFSISILKNLLSFSLPLVPYLLSNWILDFSDRVFIERYFSLKDVGIYSLAYGIASLSFLVSSSIDLAYRPTFFKYANMEDQQKGKKLISYYNTIILVVSISFAFILSLFGKELIFLLINSRFKEAYHYLPIILASNIFVVGSGLTARFYEQSKKTKQNMVIYLFAMCLNIGLNYLLIPEYSIYGAAVATILSFFFVFLYTYNYAKRKCYFTPINWNIILPLITVFIVIIICFLYFDGINIFLSLILKIILLIILSSILIIKYYKDLISLINYQRAKIN